MDKLLLLSTVFFLASCCPHQLEKFERWSKDCEAYRARNENKLLIPYVDDVIEGRD